MNTNVLIVVCTCVLGILQLSVGFLALAILEELRKPKSKCPWSSL